jgi:hypothetical protein
MSKLDFLEEPNVEEPVAAAIEAPEPVEQQEAPVEVAPEIKPEPAHVPITALMDERDKRKAAEAKLATFEQQPAPVQIPDQFEDPEGYTAAIQDQFEQRLYGQTLAISERFAVQQYGKETTDAALEWGRAKCAADPYFNAQVRQSSDPAGFAVQEYQRDQIASQVTPDDYQKFKAWQAAQAEITPQPVTPSPPIPARSIGSIPSAGGVDHVPVGPGVAYDGLFKR